MTNELIFLKLGGSLVTDKSKAYTANLNQIRKLAKEIKHLSTTKSDMRLLIGHGSGSFGHVSANQYQTRNGVHTKNEWLGFIKVWKAANALHKIIMTAFDEANLPVISFPPSAMVLSENRHIIEWNLAPIKAALNSGLIPVIQGDVIFDSKLGGTILSTEELFIYLARHLVPQKILLAGRADGVFSDFPVCQELISEITPQTINQLTMNLASSNNTDVTGGMRSKVFSMLDVVKELPDLDIHIFSGLEPGNINKIIKGENTGTIIRTD